MQKRIKFGIDLFPMPYGRLSEPMLLRCIDNGNTRQGKLIQ